jgi:5-methylthioadenosine/S-adenosylhomocysteine deaminase
VSTPTKPSHGITYASVGEPYVLDGCVVTMDEAFRVIDPGGVYARVGDITAVKDAGSPDPVGFENAPLIRTPEHDLSWSDRVARPPELHVLPMWQVPHLFAHRGQGADHPDKRRLISEPMRGLECRQRDPAIVRYVEAKCLVRSVTSSQRMLLMAAPWISHSYRGIVRNVEQADDPAHSEALTRILDVEDAVRFLERQKHARSQVCLLHLAEGMGAPARKHTLEVLGL